MTREVKDLQNRLEALLDRWIKASPDERHSMVLEKIRLEEALEDARSRSQTGSMVR